MFTNAL